MAVMIIKFLVEAPIVYRVINIPTNDKNIDSVMTCIGFLVMSVIVSFGYKTCVPDKPKIINSTVNNAKNTNKLFTEDINAYTNGIILNTSRIIIVFDGFSMIFIPPK
jgi:hypothetical protein